MNDLPKSQGKGTFSIGNWQEIRKAGGESPPPAEISKYLRGTQTKLTRGELIERSSVNIPAAVMKTGPCFPPCWPNISFREK